MPVVPITQSRARIPEMQQQFRYEDVRQPANRLQGMEVRTNADMFGASAGRDLERAGHMMQRSVDQLSQLYDDYNNTEARDAARKMQEGFLSWQSEQEKKVGKDGMNAAADYDTWAQSQRQELTKGMNEVQRGRFAQMADMQDARYRNWAAGYGQQQFRAHEVGTQEAVLSNNADMLAKNIHDPELAQIAIDQTYAAAVRLAELKGAGEEEKAAMMRKAVSGALIPAIHAKIQAGDTGTADALMKQYSERIDGAGLTQLGAQLKVERENQRLQADAAEAESFRQQQEAAVTKGYHALYELDPEEAQTRALDPEWQQSMGLTAEMARASVGLLHTMRNWQAEAQKQQRQKYEADKYTSVVNMALGVNGVKQDPVAAVLSIQSDDNIDEKTKMELMHAVQNNRIDTADDPSFVGDLRQRILDHGSGIADNEVLFGVATGKMRQSTAQNIVELREMAQGAHGPMLKIAHATLNEMLRNSTMADGTPEQAKAQLAAQMQLQADMAAAVRSGNRRELEQVTSPEHILSVERRFSLSLADQCKAILRKFSPEADGDGDPSSGQPGISTPALRNPGESIGEYRKRIGME